MKKIILIITLLLIMIPIKLCAVGQINDYGIKVNNEASVGSTHSESFYIDFKNVDKNSRSLGLWLVSFELGYDESVFAIESVSDDSNDWTTVIYKEDNKTMVSSLFTNTGGPNLCIDNTLFCGIYKVTINFYVKETDKSSGEIIMRNVMAGAFNIKDEENPEYDTDEMVPIYNEGSKSAIVNIKKANGYTLREPLNIVTNEKPATQSEPVSINSKYLNYKRDDDYLEKLVIKDYDLNFKMNILNYQIDIDENTNSLEIITKASDKKATVEVKGNDNLKESNYIITVNVKAENGSIRTYTIKLKPTKIEKEKDTNIILALINKFNYKIALIIGGSIIGVILLIIIIYNIVENRKIKKTLEI